MRTATKLSFLLSSIKKNHVWKPKKFMKDLNIIWHQFGEDFKINSLLMKFVKILNFYILLDEHKKFGYFLFDKKLFSLN